MAVNLGSMIVTLGLDTENLEKGVAVAESALKGLADSVFSLKGAIVALGTGLAANSFIDVAKQAEKARIALDTMTKGKGMETFEALRQWAIQMPVDTQAAIEMFIRLKARALDPTIAEMTRFLDVTSAMGTRSEGMYGIAKALGDIQAKGRLASQEMQQLANWGVNAREVIELGMGVKGPAAIQALIEKGVSAKAFMEAFLKWAEIRFGGMSVALMKSWSGIIEQLQDQWKSFALAVADSGPFQAMKDTLKSFLDYLNSPEGKQALVEWAQLTAKALMSFMSNITELLATFIDVVGEVQTTLKNISKLRDDLAKPGGWDDFLFGSKKKEAEIPKLSMLDPEKQREILNSGVSPQDAFSEFGGEIPSISMEKYPEYAQRGTLDPLYKKEEQVVSLSDKLRALSKQFADFAVAPSKLYEGGKQDMEIPGAKGLVASAQDLAVKNKEAEKAYKKYANEIVRESKKIYEATRTPLEAYQDQIAMLNKLAEEYKKTKGKMGIDEETYARAVKEAQDKYRDNYMKDLDERKKYFLKYVEETNDMHRNVQEAGIKVWQSMENSLVSFVRKGTFEFSNFTSAILDELARLTMQKFVMAPLSGLFDAGLSAVEGLFGGMFGSTSPSLGVKAFATGGTLTEPIAGVGLNTGRSYSFAERGVERVVPGQGGSDMGGGNISVQVINSTGVQADAKVDQRRGPNGEKQMVIELARAIAKYDIASRGPLSQAMENRYGMTMRGAR